MKRREFILAGTIGTMGATLRSREVRAGLCPPPTVQSEAGQALSPVTSTACGPTKTVTPAWLQGKAVYQWVALQSPSASGATPNPSPPGSVAAVTDAWGGGALRASGSYFILHGGGHGDYGGNEVYAMKLSDDAPAWQRVWGPTPNASITEGTFYYADGNPAAIHTYYFLCFNDVTDTLMRFAKGAYVQPSGLSPGVDGWHWGDSKWQPQGTYPDPPGGSTFYTGQGLAVDVDGNVYVANAFVRLVWSRANNSWGPGPNTSLARTNNAMVYDSARKCIWSFGGNTPGKVLRWDVSANSEAELALTGSAAGSLNNQYMGAAYDATADRVFVFDPAVAGVYEFDPTSLSASLVVAAGTPPVSSTNSATGAWGKFRYVPELGGVVLQPTWNSATLFMRTH